MFRTRVTIEMADGVKQVKRSALSPEGIGHLEHILRVRETYGDYYKRIGLVECEKEGPESLVCPFICGTPLSEVIERESKDYPSFTANAIKWAEVITDVNESYVGAFSLSKEFEEIFGRPYGIEAYHGRALRVCNLDSTFENFLIADDKTICVDFEWFVEAGVPVDFVRYRALKMLCIANLKTKCRGVSIEKFLSDCGFSEDDILLFDRMDEAFQQYVHGRGREAIYTERYRKKITDFGDLTRLPETIEAQEDRIRKAEAKNKDLTDKLRAANDTLVEFSFQMGLYRKALYNPAYAAYRLTKKAGKKILPTKVKKGLKVLKEEGYNTFKYKMNEHRVRRLSYETWIKGVEEDRHIILTKKELKLKPLISVLVPVYNVKSELLSACIDSVIAQTYPNWQLCLVDDASTMEETRATLKRYEDHPQIDIAYRSENGHISKATDQALEMARGDYVALLDCDDLLTRDALLEVACAINENPEAEYLYSDEDKIDEAGKVRFDAFFKPDWAPDTLMAHMYTCHLSVYKKELMIKTGALRPGYEGSQDYDLALRATEIADYKNIIHIPQILYHWRTRPESTSSGMGVKPYVIEATRKAKEDALSRRGIKAALEFIDVSSQFRVRYIPDRGAFVSIIIPSKDNPEVIERCIKSIVKRTEYKGYEIIVIDNGSSPENKISYERTCASNNCRYFHSPMEFNFSKMCNLGAKYSRGDHLLFLNDDTEVIDGEWLDRMLGQAQQSHTGAVGAKLLYSDSNRIQHIGVLNLMPGPDHALGRMDDSVPYYFGVNIHDTNFIAVTGACLMVGRDKFFEVGGFDEDLMIAYNDVDLCFRLLEAGYYNVSRMDVRLYHYESYSRGIDTMDETKLRRLTSERERLYIKHPQFSLSEHMDPFYNHHLVQNKPDYSFNFHNLNHDKKETCRIRNLSDYETSTDLVCQSEICIVSETNAYVTGWAYLKGYGKKDDADIKVLFIDKSGKAAEYDTMKMYRPDTVGRTGRQKLRMIGYMLCTATDTDFSHHDVAVSIGGKYIRIVERDQIEQI